MRIVFIGTVEFSRHCLQTVLNENVDDENGVVAVFTLAREHARFNSDYADLKPIAAAHQIPVYHIRKINEPKTVALIRALRPDVIFVFGFSQLIAKEILDIPPLGCIGTHPALLPRNRGRHPLIWALVEGLSESGLTFFYLGEGADDGDILWQKPFPITLSDDAGTLYEKIKGLADEAIQTFLPQLEGGNAPRKPQDHAQATYWRKRSKKDGEIDWSAPTMTTYNLIRALTQPYVGAHTYLDGHEILIWRSHLPTHPLPEPALAQAPGTILAHSAAGWAVKTGDHYLHIQEWEGPDDPSGSFSLSVGQQFTTPKESS